MTAAGVAFVMVVTAAWVAACWPAAGPALVVVVVVASLLCHIREAQARAHRSPR